MNNIDKIMENDYIACHFPFLWLYGGETVESVILAVERAKEMGVDGITIEPRDFKGFDSEACTEWFTLLSAIIEKAHELGLKIIIVDEDSKCPTGHAFGAVGKPENSHLRRKSVVESHIDVIGPCNIDLVVGKPKVYDGEPWVREPVKDEVIGCYLYSRTDKNNGIDMSDTVDLTDNIKDGMLSCSIPEGNYRIMFFYAGARFSTMYNDDFIDVLDNESVDLLIHGVYDMYEKRYKKYFGDTIIGFFSDEPFIGNGYAYCRTGYGRNQDTRIGHTGITFPYNKNIKERLDAIYGENCLKFFPSLWYWDEKISPEFRKNYMNVISVLYKECFSTRIGEWCRKRGLMYIGHVLEDNNLHSRIGNGPGHYFRSQQGQSLPGMDIVMHQIMPGFADINLGGYGADVYNTEFYHYILAKLASSAAHTYKEFNGKAMCELTIGYGWAEGTQIAKWLFDYLFVRGINFFVPGCSVATFPDNIHAPHFGAEGGAEPQQKGFTKLLDYSKKVATVFDGSEHICNALILYHAQAEWMSDNDYMLMERPAKKLYDSHIDFDVLSDDLLDTINVINKKIHIKERYDCLIVPYAKYLPKDLLDKLNVIKGMGADIVFVDGLPVNCDYEFNVITLDKIADYFIKNDYYDIKVEDFHLLRHYHAVKDNTHYYLFFNESVNQKFNGEVYTGKTGNYNVYNFALNMFYSGNGDRVKLSLEPYESCIVVYEDNRGFETFIDLEKLNSKIIDADYKISLYDYKDMDKCLKAFTTRELYAISRDDRTFSGKVVYEFECELEKAEKAYIKFEHCGENARLIVNDKDCGFLICPPFIFNVNDAVKDGINKIRIEVYTTLANSIRDHVSMYVPIAPTGVNGKVEYKFKR